MLSMTATVRRLAPLAPLVQPNYKHYPKKYFQAAGQNYTAAQFDGRSDYEAFLNEGIPVGGTFTGAKIIRLLKKL